jgi:glycerophosphoryl diester phosphodiesterase
MAEDGAHPRLIAHGGGAVYGYRLTNSLEALDNAYAEGFRYIELDMVRASDGGIVLLHDWESMAGRLLGEAGERSREDFLAAPALDGLTLLDAEGLFRWMEEHPDCCIITDYKGEDNVSFLRELRELAGEAADRFIPQAYSFEEAAALREEGWERIILTLYRMQASPEELWTFLRVCPLWAAAMPQERISEELAAAVTGSGTAVYCHTVNSLDFVDAWRDKGLTGIYTDYFQPAHWVY